MPAQPKTSKASDGIRIPEINLRRLIVTIEGLTPIITHRFGERAMREIEKKQQGEARMKKEPRVPEQEFYDALYTIAPGRYGFPAAGLKKALVYAGGRFTDEQMTILRGIISIEGDLLEIRGSDPVMRSDMVRIDGGRVSTVAYRPMFEHWQMDVPVVYNATMITEAQVLNLFQMAGFSIGIGNWRPEKNGTFGQFRTVAVGYVETERPDGASS